MDCTLWKTTIHYALHFLFPIAIAYLFYRKQWRKTAIILLTTMLVDLDHLLATPIFDATRNSIGFHYLHTYYAITAYLIICFFTKGNYRIAALGLLLHMATDYQDFAFWHCG